MGRTPPGQTRERVFRFVRDRLLAGLPPTVREIQQSFGFRSVQTAREHLETLVAAGKWDKTPPGPRLPDEIVERSLARYLEAYQRLTGRTLSL